MLTFDKCDRYSGLLECRLLNISDAYMCVFDEINCGVVFLWGLKSFSRSTYVCQISSCEKGVEGACSGQGAWRGKFKGRD